MTFVDNQSFLHRTAVELLAGWLREIENSDTVGCTFGDLKWRKNWGVHTELKFHEFDSPFYFEHVKEDRGRILFVPDITIFHKGSATILIEVVHKSPPTNDKLFEIYKFFYENYIEVYTISAYYIMAQVTQPKELNFKRLL